MTDRTGKIECDEFIAHPPTAVWRALTDPELQARWWAPGDVRPIVGHHFTIDLAPWGELACEVLAVEPERLIRYRLGGDPYDTILTWRLVPEGRGTRLVLEQAGFDLDSPLAKQAYERMTRGWPIVLQRIDPALAELAT